MREALNTSFQEDIVNTRKKRFMLLFSMIFAVAMASCSRSLEDGIASLTLQAII